MGAGGLLFVSDLSEQLHRLSSGFHSSCVQLPNNVPRAFSTGFKMHQSFLFPQVKRHRRLGPGSLHPGCR